MAIIPISNFELNCSIKYNPPLLFILLNGKVLQQERDVLDEHLYLKNDDIYGPAINKLYCHLPHVTILGTNYC